jgi:hypothetical protein
MEQPGCRLGHPAGGDGIKRVCVTSFWFKPETVMNPIAVVILVCSASLGRPDCQLNTAIDVIRGPNVANEMMCAFIGQTTLAATALTPREGQEYVKILCMRSDAKRTARLEARDGAGAEDSETTEE